MVFDRGDFVASGGERHSEAAREHQEQLREAAEREHEAKDASAGERHRWWPFGKRREKPA